jgi:hypothetical protein
MGLEHSCDRGALSVRERDVVGDQIGVGIDHRELTTTLAAKQIHAGLSRVEASS